MMRLLISDNCKHFSKTFSPYLTAADDGFSGVSFDREGLQAMLQEVEAGHVATVITKDYCAIIGLNQKGLENQGILA